MKHFIRLATLSLVLLASAIGGQAQPASESDLHAAVSEACTIAARLPGLSPAKCNLSSIERRHVIDDIYEYSFLLKVGDGEHDQIGIHRVVKETEQGMPIRARESIFMVHGDLWGFDQAFMSSTLSSRVPRQQSIGIFLAAKGVDVWGVDLRWVQVPANTTDVTFMKDWNIQTHVRDIAAAIGVARTVRRTTGSGFGKTTLMGWSRGAILAYAYANEEARMPAGLRQVKALVPVDIAFKLNPEHEEQRAGACTRYRANKQLLDAGQYASALGTGVRTFGLLAAMSPSSQSPVPGFTNFTNAQVALLVGSATHMLFAPNPPVPSYHLNAGTFNEYGIPVGLQFTEPEYLYDYFQTAAPFQSSTEIAESEAIICNEVDIPYDDNLAEITIPVLYVGAKGGFGEFGTDTLSRLGSTDATAHVVQLHGPEARAVDFGHADLFLSPAAKELVWNPIYNWLTSH